MSTHTYLSGAWHSLSLGGASFSLVDRWPVEVVEGVQGEFSLLNIHEWTQAGRSLLLYILSMLVPADIPNDKSRLQLNHSLSQKLIQQQHSVHSTHIY